MKRRNFLKQLPAAMSIPFTIGGIPLKLMANNPLARLAGLSSNDRVLIILQMHGGNDGVNCLIPIEDYDLYYSRRANIAIPLQNSIRKAIKLDATLPTASQVGLHPDMQAMKTLYDQGRMTAVQGVSYKNNNGSHFRGRDIWFMGGGSDDYYSSGWVGRFLEKEFEDLGQYPEDFPVLPEMPDPLAIEMGSDVSLIFHQSDGFPTSISLNDPAGFAELVEELDGFQDKLVDPRGKPPTALNDTPYGKELNWILGLEDKTEDYAERLYEVFLAGGESTVTYPESYPFNAPTGNKRNTLSPQLRLIARLLAGGCKTKVFLVKIGGFDTHADQVETYDPTMGVHAALMYNVSSAMKAFQDDLRARGLEDRVLSVTTSEFGRRIHSNGSYGTDHGTGGPIFIFGKGVKPGVVGTTPDLNQNNIEMQYDYRQVYANLLKDWMQVDQSVIDNDVFFGNFINGTVDGVTYSPLPLVSDVITGNDDFISARWALYECYPNPVSDKVNIRFRTNGTSQVVIKLYDNTGKEKKLLVNGTYDAGQHAIVADVSDLPAGNYIYQMKAGFFKSSKKISIMR